MAVQPLHDYPSPMSPARGLGEARSAPPPRAQTPSRARARVGREHSRRAVLAEPAPSL
eukprot:CAMPEP_0185185598 /NCGR_PEP_ID=MMETSP1140-20130426/3429_1 /TAXON_ID=298111 /ORGANISM="Pavlova sp., Strain CCMP459" /LENGTH=57 /DNA_ID=CAMNT_0027751795 /DNA_START=172 /DNA_END=342 /DNA_ORIENTATION=-